MDASTDTTLIDSYIKVLRHSQHANFQRQAIKSIRACKLLDDIIFDLLKHGPSRKVREEVLLLLLKGNTESPEALDSCCREPSSQEKENTRNVEGHPEARDSPPASVEVEDQVIRFELLSSEAPSETFAVDENWLPSSSGRAQKRKAPRARERMKVSKESKLEEAFSDTDELQQDVPNTKQRAREHLRTQNGARNVKRGVNRSHTAIRLYHSRKALEGGALSRRSTTGRKRGKNFGTDRVEDDILVFVPAGSDAGWHILTELPIDVSNNLLAIFHEAYRSTELKESNFDIMKRNHKRHIQDDRCVGNVVIGCRSYPMRFRDPNGDRRQACETCRRKGRPCARLVEYDSSVHLGFFPLHEVYRGGTSWKDLGFWIQQ